MGIGSYFKAEKPDKKQKRPATTAAAAIPPPAGPSASGGVLEKTNNASLGANDFELQPPTPNLHSSRNSIRSARSGASSMFLDDIKHEVMVNYLYQQQCSHLWVSDGSGEVEGVLLRKWKGQYMACPQELGNSPFARACAELNVHVSLEEFLLDLSRKADKPRVFSVP